MDERVVGRRARGDLGRERDELLAQALQQRLQARDAHAGLVLVEQGVVALAALVADGVGLLAAQRDDLRERIAEEREVGGLARRLPGLEAARLGLRERATSSAGTRTARSRSRLASRTRAARRSSRPASRSARRGRHRSAHHTRSCRTPASVALAAPLAEAPRAGMLRTCSSKSSSEPTRASWRTSASNCSKNPPGLRLGGGHQGLSGWLPATPSIMPISEPAAAIAKPHAKRL